MMLTFVSIIALLLQTTSASFDDRCCFAEQPTTGPSSCSGDGFCAGPDACKDQGDDSPFSCGQTKAHPDIECQNCGCCPCCHKNFVCCKSDSETSKETNFIVDVQGGPSPMFNKGECRAECENNCNGHGSCQPGPAGSCPANSCVCTDGFDPVMFCSNCLPLHWGTTCNICPGVISPGTSGAVACNGHGTCDGDGSKQKGTGQCTCSYGWKGDDCSELYCPKGCDHGKCITKDNIHPTCECEKGWSDETCSLPKCPSPLAPGIPGCVHGNCSKTKLEACDCEPGWGDSRCSTPICTQGCVIGKGTCIAPDDCKCVTGYSGTDCGSAFCHQKCVEGQGDCSTPDHCTCRPNYQGITCEINNAACCYSSTCGDAPTSCGICCQYPRGERVHGTNIVGCAGDKYTCRNCDCEECCTDGGYCSKKLSMLLAFSKTKGSNNAKGETNVEIVEDSPPTPSFSGKCCQDHREGKTCDECVSGYYGSTCKACPGFVDRSKEGEASIVCSGHGKCNEGIIGSGNCTCESGFSGNTCGECDDSYCPMHCSGHGSCDCSVSGSDPKCDCVNGFGGDTIEGNDLACRYCKRGFSETTNCTDCSAGWYGGDSLSSENGLLICRECDCDAQYCNDGNNGTGKCTHPPRPNTPSGSSGGNIPITAIVSSCCGLAFVGMVVYFVGKSKKRARSQEHQKQWETQSLNDSLLTQNQSNQQKNEITPPGGGYNGFNILPEDQQIAKADQMFGNDETLEARLARMAAE